MANSSITVEQLNDVFVNHLDQNFGQSVDDRGGCYMHRGGIWLCPQLITNLVQELLDVAEIEVEGLNDYLTERKKA